MMNFYSLFWSIAKHTDPETIHHTTLQLLHTFPGLAKIFTANPHNHIRGHHISWRNSIGIAAGLDKNGLALNFWDQLGVGCIEIGTVTPKAQYGNEKPRIFRIKNQNLINSMGFPNEGADSIFKNLMKFKALQTSSMPIWVNLGKQKNTSLSNASQDYNFLINKFATVADALVINISSPNTADLRLLQTATYLESFLHELSSMRDAVNKNCPLLLKISPDESLQFYQEISSLLKKYQWQGLIATNTTAQHSHGKGGLSGHDLFQKSFDIAKILAPECKRFDLDIVYVGGLSHVDQLKELQSLPIHFFQIYTSLIYQGPNLLSTFNSYINKHE